jgi:hypothetical protein
VRREIRRQLLQATHRYDRSYRADIHAAQKLEESEFFKFVQSRGLAAEPSIRSLDAKSLPRGAVIGVVDIVDCVMTSDSPWFEGPFGFVLANPRSLKPVTCKGALQIFDLDPSVALEIERQLSGQNI